MNLLDWNIYIGQNYIGLYINVNVKLLIFSYLMEWLIYILLHFIFSTVEISNEMKLNKKISQFS